MNSKIKIIFNLLLFLLSSYINSSTKKQFINKNKFCNSIEYPIINKYKELIDSTIFDNIENKKIIERLEENYTFVKNIKDSVDKNNMAKEKANNIFKLIIHFIFSDVMIKKIPLEEYIKISANFIDTFNNEQYDFTEEKKIICKLLNISFLTFEKAIEIQKRKKDAENIKNLKKNKKTITDDFNNFIKENKELEDNYEIFSNKNNNSRFHYDIDLFKKHDFDNSKSDFKINNLNNYINEIFYSNKNYRENYLFKSNPWARQKLDLDKNKE